jgi:hypothetical protein
MYVQLQGISVFEMWQASRWAGGQAGRQAGRALGMLIKVLSNVKNKQLLFVQEMQ